MHLNRIGITALVIIVGLVTLVFGLALSISLGAKDIGLLTVFSSIFAGNKEVNSQIIRDIRIPRAIGAAMVGAFLAVSGAIILGITSGAAFNALLIVFQLKFTTQEFNRVMVWISGSIWGSNWSYVLATLPWIIVFIALTIYKARYLDVLKLGDQVATGLGVNVERERRLLLIYTVGLAGVATAVAGSIAFLGLIALHIAYKNIEVVKDLNLIIPKGKITTIIGANGCGKSTILKTLARFLEPKSGVIYINGKDIQNQSSKEIAKIMAVLPQTPQVPNGLTVAELAA